MSHLLTTPFRDISSRRSSCTRNWRRNLQSSTPGVARRSSRPVYAPCQGCSVMIYSNGFHHTRHGQAELHWTPQHGAVRGNSASPCRSILLPISKMLHPYRAPVSSTRDVTSTHQGPAHRHLHNKANDCASTAARETCRAAVGREAPSAAVSRVTLLLRRVSRPVSSCTKPQATKAAYLSTDTTFLSWAKQRRKRDGATAIAGPPTLPPSGGRAASVLKGC